MEIIWNINNLTTIQPSILTLGTFDGVHLGHQEIIARLNKISETSTGKSTLITFEPHPQLVIPRADRPIIGLLTTIEEKLDLLQAAGLDRLVIANFTQEFAATEPESFIKEILLKKLALKHIVIGHDHAFGRGRAGRIELLQQLEKIYDFNVEVVTPVQIDDKVVSSTLIREMILNGDVNGAGSLLGRNYFIRGQVIRGDGRGRDLGFPTANIRPPSQYKLIPRDGVYAGIGVVDNVSYDCIISIGFRPTFDSKSHGIEVHLIGFDGSLYEHEIEIQFINRIRDELAFSTTEELVEQMQKDKTKSLELLGSEKK